MAEDQHTLKEMAISQDPASPWGCYDEQERKWYQNGEVTIRVYRRLLLIDLYNQFMDGVDLKDQLCWYYRFCGKRMWRTQVWHTRMHDI